MDGLAWHLNYLNKFDPHFAKSWPLRSAVCGPRLWAIEQMHQKIRAAAVQFPLAHANAISAIRRELGNLPNYDFLHKPPIVPWAKFARSTRRVSTLYQHASAKLHRLVSQLGPFPFYGCVKDLVDVQAGLQRARFAGLPPDLWDLVRFRVVCPHVNHLSELVNQILRYFGSCIVRCRNYYSDPRNGILDPYRNIHLEVQYDAEEFAEIQLGTANREAIGQIDHSMVRKRSVRPKNVFHSRWLREISWIANILDAQPLSPCFSF
jgi:Region found in RelA / SpoT proteins